MKRAWTSADILPSGGPRAIARSGARTILIVDDDPNAVELLEAVLRDASYCPVSADNAEQALVLAGANPPAVVIVDLLMPGTDGFEFVARLRATPAGHEMPIIVWTVKDLDADERRWLEASAAVIVTKSEAGADAVLAELRRLLPADQREDHWIEMAS